LQIRIFVCLCVVAALSATLLPARVQAHAIVLKSSLREHPIKKGIADSVALHFNSRIEVKLSRAVLVSRDQSDRPLVMAAGKKPGEVMVELPPLEPGDYALRYRVLAADGHVTEETLRFTVAP
jgi:methionine-rich copper-binding protein CopC